MKRLTAVLCFLLFCLPAWGQEITLTGVKKIVVEKVMPVEPGQVITQADFPLTATVPPGGFGYSWDFPEGFKTKRKANKLDILTAPKGNHRVSVEYSVVDFDAKKVETLFLEVAITVGDGPGPKPPPDPDPDPDPDPPPVPTGGLTVLILYESADKAKLPSAQSQIFTSVPVRQYLQAKCVADPSPVAADGKAYRIWDDDEPGTGDTKLWQDLAKRQPDNITPWIYVSNGKAVFEGPLPLTPDATIELLKKYAGP